MAEHSNLCGLLLAGALLALAACQSAPPRPLYQPLESGAEFGYIERQIDDTHWEVIYVGPRYRASHDEESGSESDAAGTQAYDLALWRAAQITLEQKRGSFAVVFERRDIDRSTQVRSRYPSYPYYPFGFRYPGYWGYRPWYFNDYSVRSFGEVSVRLTIDLEPDPDARSFDANVTADRLESEYAFKTWPPQ